MRGGCHIPPHLGTGLPEGGFASKSHKFQARNTPGSLRWLRDTLDTAETLFFFPPLGSLRPAGRWLGGSPTPWPLGAGGGPAKAALFLAGGAGRVRGAAFLAFPCPGDKERLEIRSRSSAAAGGRRRGALPGRGTGREAACGGPGRQRECRRAAVSRGREPGGPHPCQVPARRFTPASLGRRHPSSFPRLERGGAGSGGIRGGRASGGPSSSHPCKQGQALPSPYPGGQGTGPVQRTPSPCRCPLHPPPSIRHPAGATRTCGRIVPGTQRGPTLTRG